mmetsp:Transcript_54073/g.140826  ORF Transcript_54073/g.140826 Transcript_54073/m.140826 type:complete len:207 (+) Transcript_54073:732-1352(+)
MPALMAYFVERNVAATGSNSRSSAQSDSAKLLSILHRYAHLRESSSSRPRCSAAMASCLPAACATCCRLCRSLARMLGLQATSPRARSLLSRQDARQPLLSQERRLCKPLLTSCRSFPAKPSVTWRSLGSRPAPRRACWRREQCSTAKLQPEAAPRPSTHSSSSGTSSPRSCASSSALHSCGSTTVRWKLPAPSRFVAASLQAGST